MSDKNFYYSRWVKRPLALPLTPSSAIFLSLLSHNRLDARQNNAKRKLGYGLTLKISSWQEKLQYWNFPIICYTEGPINLEKREHFEFHSFQPPTITGARSRYRRGEEVDLNCTVEATMPPANISWYINQRMVSAQKARDLLFINCRQVHTWELRV